MELLVLMLAMFVRAVFLQPKGWLNIQQNINVLINGFVKSSHLRLNVLLISILIVSYAVFLFFGKHFFSLLEVVLFIYLFFILHEELPVASVAQKINRVELIEKIKSFNEDYECVNQSYNDLLKALYSLWLYRLFTSTFVLVFWYLATGWVGLLVYSFVYYIKPNKSPYWLSLLRHFLEIPAGFLSALSCAVAGRMDSVITVLLTWRVCDLDNGRHMFESSMCASMLVEFEEETFYEYISSCKRLATRSVYVWLFVVALMLII